MSFSPRKLTPLFLLTVLVHGPVVGQGYWALVPEAGGGAPGKSAALVIGNSDYEHARPLQNPGNDGVEMVQRSEGKPALYGMWRVGTTRLNQTTHNA